jgi:predicted TIM-barrel fold metal-dependent hydrolase
MSILEFKRFKSLSLLLLSVSAFPKIVHSASFITPSSKSASKSATTKSTTRLQMSKPTKIIDSHLHIWGNLQQSQNNQYPYASIPDQIPPPSLIDQASPKSLLKYMKEASVDGCLIVQPINYKYDHSYVTDAIKDYPHLFKGMLLHDPSTGGNANESGDGNGLDYTLNRLEDLILKGFVGVRFNPYLWPRKNENDNNIYMSKGTGMEVYKKCGALNIPVGIMCFKGLDLHYDDIVQLLQKSPDTIMILDHFGFTSLGLGDSTGTGTNNKDKEKFDLLLSLSKYDNVIVKISALFRIAGTNDPYPYERVQKEIFDILLSQFGKDRLMFGTDFPFVLNEEGGYKGTVDLVKKWTDGDEDVQNAIMYGNAERLFGIWGK